ncbi:syndecan-like isoform X2 [Styela clava]|uniref:syndecan-2-B-like isoform X2 n=1 Tax=Styela clava TaxID=7725 RepID=UPI00193996C3|nr:syndecan-2-B-like isoform X2 [Styela clava]
MKFVELLIFCICLIGISHAQMDLYFEPEESSGDGATHTVNPDLPIDDEDTDDDEGSGAPIPTSENDDDADIEEIDVGEEPEVNGEKAKTPIKVHELPKDLNKGTKGVGTKGVLAEEDEPEQKNVKTTELEDEEMEPVGASPTKDPSFLGAIIAGACIGLLFAICVIMLLVYRMRKKDEGSYALEYGVDGKKPQGNYEYTKGVAGGKEYFA